MKPSNFSIVAILSAVLIITGCAGKDSAEVVKPADEMYQRAHKLLNRNAYEVAAQKYIELIRAYPYGKYTTQARLDIAYAYYKNGDTARAIAAVDEFINFYPEHPHIDYAYYLKGLIHLPIQTPKFGERFFTDQETFSDHAAASARESFKAFKEVTQRFPFSEYADASRQNMIDLINVFARNEVRIARFYMHRKAYVGAINRAKTVLEEYPQSLQTEEALAILVYSYNQLGLDDLAADSRRVLHYNFPESQYLISGTAIFDEELVEKSEKKFLFGLFR